MSERDTECQLAILWVCSERLLVVTSDHSHFRPTCSPHANGIVRGRSADKTLDLSGNLEIWDGIYSGLYQRWSRKAQRTIRVETINNSELETQVNAWWRERIQKRKRREQAREREKAGVKRRRDEALLQKESGPSKTREKVDLGRIWCREKHKWVQPANV